VGPPDVRVSRVAPLERAESGDLAFLASARYLSYFQRSAASVVLVREEFVTEAAGPAVRVVVPDPHAALLTILPVLYPQAVWEPGVHPTAVIGRGTTWEDPVAIGPPRVLGRGGRLGRNVILAGQSGVSDHLTVGKGARVLVQSGLIGDVPAGATVSGFPARNHRELLRAQATLYRLAEIIHDLEALVAKQPDAAQR